MAKHGELTEVPAAGTSEAQATFEVFYRSARPRLLSIGYVFTGNSAQANDLADETLTRAWTRWTEVGPYDDRLAWCRRVLCNLATSEWRRNASRRRALARWRREMAEDSDGPDVEAVALAAALRTLPAAQRTAIVLHDGAGLNVAEVALELDVPEGTVRSWLYRGRVVLASKLSLTEIEPAGPGQGESDE